MQINTEFSKDNPLALLQSQRAQTGSVANLTSSATANGSETGALGGSLQRLSEAPASVQEGSWELEDEKSAAQAVETARQQILQHPGTALGSQANQIYQNVLDLLQSSD